MRLEEPKQKIKRIRRNYCSIKSDPWGPVYKTVISKRKHGILNTNLKKTNNDYKNSLQETAEELLNYFI